MPRLLFILIFIIGISSCNQNKTSTIISTKKDTLTTTSIPMSAEEKIIRSKRQLSNEAIQYKDTMGITTIWGDDIQVLTSRNIQINGIANNRHSFAEEFAKKPTVKYVRTPTEIKAFPAWRMASEVGTWIGTWAEEDGLVKITGTYYAKWHFVGNLWRVRLEVYTALTCEGSRFCDQVPILENSVPF